MTNDNFISVPKTLGEVRANRSGKSKDWTVREMLLTILRQIDSGEITPIKGVFVYASLPPSDRDAEGISYKCAAIEQDYELIGILTHAAFMVTED